MRAPSEVARSVKLAINGSSPRLVEMPREATGIATSAAADVAAVVESGRTVYWGGGPAAKKLEREFAASIGRRAAFFHSSGTAALQTALFSVGVEEGDEVALSNSGFVASLNVVYHLRARPVFLPTDPQTLVCRPGLPDAVDAHTIKAAMVTHFFGNVVDVPRMRAALPGVAFIEDAGQAHGAYLRGQPVGSFSDVGSFAGSHKKLVTAGQGGLNVFDDESVEWRMRTYAHHGKAGNFEGEFPGYNFRGGEMEAVLASAALAELGERVAARNRTAAAIRAVLDDAGIPSASVAPTLDCSPSWFDVPIVLSGEWSAPDRDWLVDALAAENVPAWRYPSLISLRWVEGYMRARGWWAEREDALRAAEARLWDRVFVLGTQMSEDAGRRSAEVIVEMLGT